MLPVDSVVNGNTLQHTVAIHSGGYASNTISAAPGILRETP